MPPDITPQDRGAELEDERAWSEHFIANRDVIRRMAREALDEESRGEALPLFDLP